MAWLCGIGVYDTMYHDFGSFGSRFRQCTITMACGSEVPEEMEA